MTDPLRIPRRRCPRPGCNRPIPRDLFACRTDWIALPGHVKRDITRAWNAAGASSHAVLTDDYRDATERALKHWESLDG